MSASQPDPFDPVAKERALRAESEAWDTSNFEPAKPGDIPVLDASDWFDGAAPAARDALAAQLREASTEVGFYSLTGHGVPSDVIGSAFDAVQQFHSLPLDAKLALAMDRPDWPVKGAGYLPVMNRKLPARKTGNGNEAYVIKREHGPRDIGLDDNQWPGERLLPGFRRAVEAYADAVEALALRLLPVYAVALGVAPDYFAPGFESPTWRLRMTRYPSLSELEEREFGIAPHVDTTFITLLAQDSEGLVIFSERRQRWLQVPMMENAFVVNTGELLRQWTNDRFISVKHFANNNTSDRDRYSIPFFFNATADYPMSCVPTCCDADNPPRYPAVSYLESQGVVQGE